MSLIARLADLFKLPPRGGSLMLSADLGTYVWRDCFGRHWLWQDQRWRPSRDFEGWGPTTE